MVNCSKPVADFSWECYDQMRFLNSFIAVVKFIYCIGGDCNMYIRMGDTNDG